MKVFVVTGEFQQSRNGDVAWVAGVGKTRKVAQVIAREDAEEYEGELVLIDGERRGDWGKVRHNSDWTLSYTIAEHEVRSA